MTKGGGLRGCKVNSRLVADNASGMGAFRAPLNGRSLGGRVGAFELCETNR